ncbi:MAG: hypothetical protein HYX87_09430 [Chloroflexi bacterium]|nr:hypothetical protein [Chloroflexota bacterium]
MKGNYSLEVLSPWAEVDPIPMKGISPRLNGLEGKTLGLLDNSKLAAGPILKAVESRLREKVPNLKFSWLKYNLLDNLADGNDRKRFEEWLSGVDGVVAAVGD